MKLTLSQKLALDALLSESNVFITGPAGTGKSYVINYYRENHNPHITVVSSTGAAAVLVNGRTFHSFFGLGLLNEEPEVIIARIKTNKFLTGRIRKIKSIIIDEISMLSGRALDVANLICKVIRGREDLPFGGIKVICCGDFYQLPPVTQDKKIDWAFNSFTWKECEFKVIELREFMRTKDEEFLSFLAKIRRGFCGPNEQAYLNRFILKKDEEFLGTRLFSRKQPVAEYNQKELAKLPGKLIKIKTQYFGVAQDLERLKRSLPIEDEVELKENAFVMIRVNDNSKMQEYVNGTIGIVLEIEPNSLLIETLDGRIIELMQHTFNLKDGDGEVMATATNFPITLAYAITIHKSQGATIDQAVLDLDRLWDSGQAYTALSRLSSPKGMKVIKYNPKSMFVDKQVVEFYRKIREENNKLIEANKLLNAATSDEPKA